jgi:hypothetical protein
VAYRHLGMPGSHCFRTWQALGVAENEIGTAPPRGRPKIPLKIADEVLSRHAKQDIRLGDNVSVHGNPEACPACGSGHLMWGCDPEQPKEQLEIHPLVWDDTELMADTFICRDCHAGWIEPDDPEVITWVRPYWIVEEQHEDR